ncbi:hypothetical protein CDL15_Pgr000006 [Punica granatum]|uniref:Uncharacterized protein n=1 Tax=Punica granatum TaxID=22663 RepID=A0A218VQM0_PUNGR|nr:hypothetical protein CDL15_Pgr000006 [Punica granatum]
MGGRGIDNDSFYRPTRANGYPGAGKPKVRVKTGFLGRVYTKFLSKSHDLRGREGHKSSKKSGGFRFRVVFNTQSKSGIAHLFI